MIDENRNIEATLAQRGARYGEFTDLAAISQSIKDIFRAAAKWDALTADKKEALDMTAHKIARVLNGDPEYKDSWHDIGGYAKLVENQLDRKVPS